MADMTGSRRYLRTCVHRMSVEEAQVLTGEQAVDLSARGALGAARYRAENGRARGLRTVAAIEQAGLARNAGFAADIRFVATDSIDENIGTRARDRHRKLTTRRARQ